MPRFITVKVGAKPAHVQVITEHVDDNAAREQAYLHETYKNQIARLEEAPGNPEDQEKFGKRCRALAKLNVEKDNIRRELLKKQLAAKHKGEEIEEFLAQCDQSNALAMELLYAAWGISLTSENSSPASTEPAAPSAVKS